MYDTSYGVLKPSLKGLLLYYMDTDSFIISFSEGNISDEYLDLIYQSKPIIKYRVNLNMILEIKS